MLEGGSRVARAAPGGAPLTLIADPEPPAPPVLGLSLPSPRAAAAAVLAMLAFGVLIGSFGRAHLQNLAGAKLLVVAQPAPPRPAPAPPPAADSVAAAPATPAAASPTITVVTTTIVHSAAPSPAAQAASPAAPVPPPITNSGAGPGAGAPSSLLGLPPVHHLFMIVLSGQGYGQTFAPSSPDKYLSGTLARQGELITNYYAVAGSALANRIALISGQGPTEQTIANCPSYTAISPGIKRSGGQISGKGCVYPDGAQTLPGQLIAARRTWKAYFEGIDRGARGEPAACRHPALGAADADHAPRPNDPYVTWSDPFVYFSALTKSSACRRGVVGLDRLEGDLASSATTPTFAFISPSACDDGSDQPCAPRRPAGLAPADAFLRAVVRKIERSPAYKDNGLIAITFDEAAQIGPHADPSACCNNPTYPNLPRTTSTSSTTSSTPASSTTSSSSMTTTTTSATTAPSTTTTSTAPGSSAAGGTGTTTPTGGGGQVGLLLISRYVKPGTTDLVDYYNHYSLLATIENLFGLKRVGYASDLQLPVFDAAIFNGH